MSEPFNLLEELLKNFLAVVPNLVGAIAILIIGLIVSKILGRLVRKLLKAIGADRLAERINEIDIVHDSNIRLVPSAFFSKIVYYFLLFVFIIAATDVLKMDVISNLMGDILNYIPVLVSAIFVLIIGLLASDALKKVVRTTCDSLAIPASKLISNVVFYFVFINIAMIALSQAQIDTDFIQSNLSIILGGIVLAFAIGYGFASRNIVANFLASFYNKGKVQVGDEIIIDGMQGVIKAIENGLLILEVGDKEVLIPLSRLATENITIIRKKEFSGPDH